MAQNKVPEKTKKLAKRVAFSTLGIVIISLGIAVNRIGGVGVDPFTAMNIGISDMLGISLGVYQLVVNLIILIPIFIFGRKQIGIGTIINLVGVGFLVDFFTWALTSTLPLDGGLVQAGICLVIGVALFTFGVSTYMNTDTGVAPYDAVAIVISNRTPAPYTPVRMAQDILVAIVAFFVGGPIGVFTVIAAFFAGPLITFWNDHAIVPLLKFAGAYPDTRARAHA
ncbi:YczE/YyaS/YitT family protein [Raoultibacter phocaeensis]|uniref:YczE/YyaS/YitT family protein n=1 Tax=Raoultibacter phocaeensis TaxID=2479841 RepID=UPI00111B7783|nr:YitT family protein [Raoultibacter phocaeensis]